jgi:hypothetical protein
MNKQSICGCAIEYRAPCKFAASTGVTASAQVLSLSAQFCEAGGLPFAHRKQQSAAAPLGQRGCQAFLVQLGESAPQVQQSGLHFSDWLQNIVLRLRNLSAIFFAKMLKIEHLPVARPN